MRTLVLLSVFSSISVFGCAEAIPSARTASSAAGGGGGASPGVVIGSSPRAAAPATTWAARDWGQAQRLTRDFARMFHVWAPDDTWGRFALDLGPLFDAQRNVGSRLGG